MKEGYFNATEFKNIKELIYNASKKYANRIAFIIKHKEKEVKYEKITYKKLLEDINALGTKLYEMGMKAKRIAIVGRNRYEWALAHLTNQLGGMVSVPLDKELKVGELENSIERSKADVVIFDEKYIEAIEEIKKTNKNVKKYISMGQIEGYENLKDLKEEGYNLLKKGNKEYINAEINSYDMSILLFTSGTTSKSKAVMLSQNNIASNVYSMQLVEDIKETDVNLAFLPYHHIFGSTAMIVMLACGAATAFPDGLKYIAQNLNEYQVSVFVGVPLLIEAIYKKINQTIDKKGKANTVKIGKTISNTLRKLHIDVRRKLFKEIIENLGGKLRLIISGGAPLDKEVAKGFTELGVEIVQGYGLTETAPVISAEDFKRRKYGSIGFPMKNVEVEFENKDENGIGELIVKGPNVMLGYYENEEATNDVIKDGWFHTGDLGYRDKDGYIFITGRKKDMIVLKNGKKVFPEELETLINRIEEVEECIVFGLEEKYDKNDVKLSVKIVYNEEIVKEKHGDISEEELEKIIWNKVKDVNQTLPQYKYIKYMILTKEELIKTTTKKVKRNEEMKKILSEI